MPENASYENPTDLCPQTPVIETASATTDPENSNSGPGAYVAFGVVAVILLLLVFVLTSTLSSLGTYIANDIEASGHSKYRDQLEELFDEELIDRFTEYESGLSA